VSEISLQTTLAMAFLLGSLHVLEPAHGRSIIHALLVGSSGRRSDVWKFGLSVVLSHIGLAGLLAVAAAFVGREMGQETLATAFRVAGALVTVGIGILMTTCGLGQHTTCSHRHGEGEASHDPDHVERHAAHMLKAHVVNPTVLGISGGLIPCQGTIALLSLSVGSGRLQSAIWLLLAFALGLGTCLIAIGLLTTMAASRASALSRRLGSSRALALAPGVLVLAMGLLALALAVTGAGSPDDAHHH
jgi:nickel/cobalt exporter